LLELDAPVAYATGLEVKNAASALIEQCIEGSPSEAGVVDGVGEYS